MPAGEPKSHQAEVLQHILQSREGIEHDPVREHIHRQGNLPHDHAHHIGQQQSGNKSAFPQEFQELVAGLALLAGKAHGEQQEQRRQNADGKADGAAVESKAAIVRRHKAILSDHRGKARADQNSRFDRDRDLVDQLGRKARHTQHHV